MIFEILKIQEAALKYVQTAFILAKFKHSKHKYVFNKNDEESKKCSWQDTTKFHLTAWSS